MFSADGRRETIEAPITTLAGSVTNDRIAAVVDALPGADVDVVAIAPGDTLTWLLGFSTLPDERLCLLLLTERGTAFVVPALNAKQSAEHAQVDLDFFVWADDEGFEKALRAGLARVRANGARRVAVDPLMRADHLLALQAHVADAQYVSAEVVLRPLREVKSKHEIGLLKQSALTADRATSAALEACYAGVAELDVAAVAAAAFRTAGADEVGFTIVASGPNGALPHHNTGRRVLQTGDSVVIDLGGRRADYCSDITRMAFIGDPNADWIEVVGVVEAAVQAGLAKARPGVAAGEVDAAARGVIDDAGYGEYFVHRTGHGLGVSVHEPPWIMRGADDVLREGMVFSIEPGIYLPGRFGVRLEEIVYTTSDGCERFSELPRTPHVVSS